MAPHIPIFRLGAVYESLETVQLVDCRRDVVLATLSQANAGIIRRDLRRHSEVAASLRRRSSAELWKLAAKAGDLFLNGELPMGRNGEMQTPRQYVDVLSATSGLPHRLCRQNMAKIHHVLTNIRSIVRGLTRGIDDLEVFDRGVGEHQGIPVSFVPVTDSLGVVLPSNSPGVNSIWLSAIAMKIPLVIKPGADEPWTPWRIIQSLVAAGFPAEAFSFYPTDHEGADAIINGCGRAMIFGDDVTMRRYVHNRAVQIHGPGRSKILIGDDVVDQWRDYLKVLIDSVLENGGRSCINVSSILVSRHANALADALAQRFGMTEPRPADDRQAVLCAFANPKFAHHINARIEEGLATTGARDVTATCRRGPRLRTLDGASYLLPTVVRCASLSHPLANTEFLFPFTSIVEVPQDQMLRQIGPSLVVTAISRDRSFMNEMLQSPLIDRLNLGPIPTTRVQWDQPHEGNLFEFLYRRRAIQCCQM